MKREQKTINISEAACDLCGTCVAVCPENVISMSINKLSIDMDGCTRCSRCIWVCPVGALEFYNIEEFAAVE